VPRSGPPALLKRRKSPAAKRSSRCSDRPPSPSSVQSSAAADRGDDVVRELARAGDAAGAVGRDGEGAAVAVAEHEASRPRAVGLLFGDDDARGAVEGDDGASAMDGEAGARAAARVVEVVAGEERALVAAIELHVDERAAPGSVVVLALVGPAARDLVDEVVAGEPRRLALEEVVRLEEASLVQVAPFERPVADLRVVLQRRVVDEVPEELARAEAGDAADARHAQLAADEVDRGGARRLLADRRERG
jgi:hypothetical protein